MRKAIRLDEPARPPGAAVCALCERAVGGISKHHLIPRSEGGTGTVDLCATCHKTLHSFFTNRMLARELNTVEVLRRHPDLQPYLKWVRKQPDRAIRVRARKERERK